MEPNQKKPCLVEILEECAAEYFLEKDKDVGNYNIYSIKTTTLGIKDILTPSDEFKKAIPENAEVVTDYYTPDIPNYQSIVRIEQGFAWVPRDKNSKR